jgi:multisubunit Na+/H+ antiporter MnhG subunit
MVVGLGFGTIVTIIALVIVMSFKVLREYQRAVVFMLFLLAPTGAHATDGFSAA